jgi:hypothetical protein
MGGASGDSNLELRQMIGAFFDFFVNKTSVDLQLASFGTPQMS